jgi:maltooligosyltrehalose trehalohydrolase
MPMKDERRLPVGAEVLARGGVHFRVWAPRHRLVEVVLEGTAGQLTVPLEPEADGYFGVYLESAGVGSRYRFRVDDGDLLPDPAARFQPEGPHGPSQVIDPAGFHWTDRSWQGVSLEGQVLYEMHVGTFTPEGTWQAAGRQLAELANLGITTVEVMPVAEFPGQFGWGYDGVYLFAPTRLYGTPDDFRRFVDTAHSVGLGVLLDVVYNHFGPDGNYLARFSPDYFSQRYENEWGDAINFDGPNAAAVREFFLANVRHWITEYHLDGLRLDATQQIFDNSSTNILEEMTRVVRESAGERGTLVVAENEPQAVHLVRPVEQSGYGMDALWNDDYHHSAMVALTGHREAYYSDYRGEPQEFISTAKYGYLYQGQHYSWQKNARGTPALDLPPARFVNFLQNHDQIANSGKGLRCHQLTSPGRYRALTTLTLLAPGTPMLFQGQEFASSAPYHYFADHHPELAQSVGRGRVEFLAQFTRLATPEMQACLPDPSQLQTFERCKLDFRERELHGETYQLHRDLLRLRREDPAFRSQRQRGVDGAVLGTQAFVLRYFHESGDRLLLVNLGADLLLGSAPEPLLAPPAGQAWVIHWSSECPRYGGNGTPPWGAAQNWRIPGEAAVVLAPAALGSP